MTLSADSAGSTETSRSAAPAKACWSVKLPGRKPFAMVGTKMKEAEALAVGGSGVIVLPWPPKELSPNARVHWAKKSKAAKQYRAECFLLTKKAGIAAPLADEILFALEFVPPDRRKRDDDNLLASCKALRDGVADALGIDDNRFITQLRISRETVKGGEVRVRIQGETA